LNTFSTRRSFCAPISHKMDERIPEDHSREQIFFDGPNG
jgi:hypothetical protein